MKTIRQALIDEILYPLPEGLVDNKLIARDINGDGVLTSEIVKSAKYRGCFADCLVALVQSVSFSESDKSVGSISDEVKKRLLHRANVIYGDIGEDLIPESEPMVYINC